MVERWKRADGSRFFGCSGYPKCRATKSIEAWNRQRAAKAKGRFLSGVEQRKHDAGRLGHGKNNARNGLE
jgi:ssDNA-binding Zn-finger/Zn-ribbon topoisomerase 1